MTTSRRGLLRAGVAAGAAALVAGCGRAVASSLDQGPAGLVEVHTRWTTEAERNGLSALLADLKGHAPNLTFTDAAPAAGRVPGGPEAELARRFTAGDPPDAVPTELGAELAAHTAADRLEGLDALYRREGWAAGPLPAGLLPLLRGEDAYRCVPLAVRRSDLLWSCPAVLAEAGAGAAPGTVPELVEDLRRVRRTGRVPLAVGGPGGARQLLEALLLGRLGADGWEALWRPGADWGSAGVAGALRDFDVLLGLSDLADPADHAGSGARPIADPAGGEAATRLVGSGLAGYQVIGDRAEEMLRAGMGLRPGAGYGWAAAPGTAGVFRFRADAFALPRAARRREASLAWLAECGSLGGQVAFSGARGSIPARTDLPAEARALFGAYQRWSMDEWRLGRITGPATWSPAADAAILGYLDHRDPPRFQAALAGG
ncbi:hypothetical protein [Kitasatospora camelliae]|uniref:Carbohydrate ABC transporter substrate-binding protein (CUT1 family) n=1 Tax=Kitasatospora camelliae TaxID=3156397 RepID=A0AAU8JYY0_9ACTN